MQKEIIILGGIGNTERQNRDDKRVLSGGGYNLHSEIPHSNRQAVSIEKNPKIAGNFSGHQWGVTSCRYGVLPTIVASNYKYPPLVIKVCGNK